MGGILIRQQKHTQNLSWHFLSWGIFWKFVEGAEKTFFWAGGGGSDNEESIISCRNAVKGCDGLSDVPLKAKIVGGQIDCSDWVALGHIEVFFLFSFQQFLAVDGSLDIEDICEPGRCILMMGQVRKRGPLHSLLVLNQEYLCILCDGHESRWCYFDIMEVVGGELLIDLSEVYFIDELCEIWGEMVDPNEWGIGGNVQFIMTGDDPNNFIAFIAKRKQHLTIDYTPSCNFPIFMAGQQTFLYLVVIAAESLKGRV